ncbi:MAG: alpha-L-fucosidase precursor [Verrucomicrobia bacterium]|jgi:alpha-L-fucosidase|nr:alpha-L-fucosidase precursor [Verrucomicrobiota bacterium]
MINRRQFVKIATASAGVCASGSFAFGKPKPSVPSYLKGYEDLYARDPRQAALRWFKEAKFGLFIHYGLYSLLEGHYKGKHSRPAEWVLRNGKVPLPEYEKLADRFTAEKFDADFITDMALDAGMKYINITTRHHDSFCLWDTKTTDFKSTNSPAKRDLVAELAEQCQQKGLGLCLYYSHGRDWRHPHGPESLFPAAEVDYQNYVDFMSAQVKELLTNYGPIAAIWLDGIGGAWNTQKQAGGRDVLQTQELYKYIRSLQPQVLVSYKQGYLGTEDFMAPERHFKGKAAKPLEICNTLQGHSWGYDSADEGRHRKPNAVMDMLKKAKAMPANLLLNTGPLPDGSIHPDDIETLRAVGQRLRKDS